jgi:electron transfer flavoprotein alpha subunit
MSARADDDEEDFVGPVLVLVERSRADATVCRSTCALLTIARRLGTPVAVLCGPADAAGIARLGRFGATIVCTVNSREMAEHPAAARVETLVQLCRRMSPTAILISSGHTGQEIGARVAVRLDSGIISDAIDIRMSRDGCPVAVQSVLADSYRVESSVVRGTPVFTVRAGAVTPEEAPVDPTVRTVQVTFPVSVQAVRLVSRVPRSVAGYRPDLATAAVVVAGGHGIGSRDSFHLVDRVAEALGGAVGGSHTATELGWCPRHARIDQIGRIVHPRLYLALGISGSVRHRAGMQGAGTIVAINDDPAAPIFGIADLGVLGNLHRVVPELLAEIRRRKAQPSLESEISQERR